MDGGGEDRPMAARRFQRGPAVLGSLGGLLLILLGLAACQQVPAGDPLVAGPSSSPKRIVGYFTSWSVYGHGFEVSDIPAGKLTHVNYAYANIDPQTGACVLGDYWTDDANLRAFGELKARHPHLKLLISVGGWTWSGHFSDVALSGASRQRFVESCIDAFLVGPYAGIVDGIDIDWEYPVGGGLASNTTRPQDKRNYTLLMKEFRRQLDALEEETGRHYLLTIAAPAGPEAYANIELRAISPYLDWLNLMAYDFHGGWDEVTNFHAPLYASPTEPAPDYLNVNAAVQGYLDAGVPSEKIVLGVPFYGRGWAGVPDRDNGLYQPVAYLPPGTWEEGIFDYSDLAANYVDRNGYARYWHEQAKAPWLYNASEGVFIGYEDAQSLALKADYVLVRNLGGVMFWELSADDGSLLDVLAQRLRSR
jgi:chitinase